MTWTGAPRKGLGEMTCLRTLRSTLLVFSLVAASPQPSADAVELRRVKRVADGDAILLENGERVRLIGIDAPEAKYGSKATMQMGEAAAAFARKLAEGKLVRLEFDQANVIRNHKDNRKRTLAYVFLEDGTFLNAEIVKQGYAFTIPGFVHKYQSEFLRLEREARESGRGLWGRKQ